MTVESGDKLRHSLQHKRHAFERPMAKADSHEVHALPKDRKARKEALEQLMALPSASFKVVRVIRSVHTIGGLTGHPFTKLENSWVTR